MAGPSVHHPDAPPPDSVRKAAPSRPGRLPATLRIAWIANTACAALYLAWLAGGRRESLFYDRDAVLYLLPVVPVVAVYLFLMRATFPDRPRPSGRTALSDWLRRPSRRR